MEFIRKLISGAIAILQGMKMVFTHNFRPATTIEYPEKKDKFTARLRGHIAVASNEDGSINCIDCKSCVRVCPCGDLINIQTHKDDEGKLCFDRFSIDIGRCIVCGNCVDVCPKSVLLMSDEYEVSQYKKEDLVYELDDLKLSYEKSHQLQSELEKGG
jgi:NADH-quinone oxidoreductase subunit I